MHLVMFDPTTRRKRTLSKTRCECGFQQWTSQRGCLVFYESFEEFLVPNKSARAMTVRKEEIFHLWRLGLFWIVPSFNAKARTFTPPLSNANYLTVRTFCPSSSTQRSRTIELAFWEVGLGSTSLGPPLRKYSQTVSISGMTVVTFSMFNRMSHRTDVCSLGHSEWLKIFYEFIWKEKFQFKYNIFLILSENFNNF